MSSNECTVGYCSCNGFQPNMWKKSRCTNCMHLENEHRQSNTHQKPKQERTKSQKQIKVSGITIDDAAAKFAAFASSLDNTKKNQNITPSPVDNNNNQTTVAINYNNQPQQIASNPQSESINYSQVAEIDQPGALENTSSASYNLRVQSFEVENQSRLSLGSNYSLPSVRQNLDQEDSFYLLNTSNSENYAVFQPNEPSPSPSPYNQSTGRDSHYNDPEITVDSEASGIYSTAEVDEQSSQDSSSDTDEEDPIATDLQSQWRRDWTNEFHSILAQPDSLAKYVELTHLSTDFVATATNYGRIIISERFLPTELKTIRPIDIGGFAGGEKYIVQGILFKFAQDQKIDLGAGRAFWLYGGSQANDSNAMKAAGLELLSLICFHKCVSSMALDIPIRYPLMCCIDFRGYRLTACSLLPIKKDTIVYGSNDGGQTVHADPVVHAAMEQVMGRALHLKVHASGQDKTVMYGPGDLEIHKSNKDNKYYALDFARLWPPEAPASRKFSNEIYYKLLRPQFVMNLGKKKRTYPSGDGDNNNNYNNPEPDPEPAPESLIAPNGLSSDAFSRWGSYDPESGQHNQEVIAATEHLHNRVIPQCAQYLERQFESLRTKPEYSLARELHARGINLRHLGVLRSAVSDPALRRHILTEMVARVVKQVVHDKLQKKMEIHKVASEAPFNQVLIDLLNMVLGHHSKSYLFWVVKIKNLIRSKYRVGLSEAELDIDYDLSRNFEMSELFVRLEDVLAIKLSVRVKQNLQERNKGVQRVVIIAPDLEQVSVKVKHMNVNEEASATCLLQNGLLMLQTNPGESRSLLNEALRQFYLVLRSFSNPSEILQKIGKARYALALIAEEDDRHPHLPSAIDAYKSALEEDPDNSNILFEYGGVLVEMAKDSR